jgi:hypothetical protein
VGGDPEILLEDLLEHTDRHLWTEVRKLSPENCHLYLGDLSRDERVMDVRVREERENAAEVNYVRLRVA